MIEVSNLAIRQGDFALEGISFRIEAGEYAVLMGQTGRGKTTILEAICGLRRVSSGQILLKGHDVTEWSPADREVGYVPQDLALFPTMTVRQHLAFALTHRKASKKVITERVEEMATLLGIGDLLSRKTQGLSGGESQRVALGRALSFHPDVLLLDEPLSALDEQTREEMQALLSQLQTTTQVTTLHVTHNTQEAEQLADRRLELKNGRIVEAGTGNKIGTVSNDSASSDSVSSDSVSNLGNSR